MQYTLIARRFGLHCCLALMLGITSLAPLQAETTYSGRAFAAFVNTPLTGPFHISDTGDLPSSGGFRSDALFTTRGIDPVDDILIADVLVASTSGAGDRARSSASLANVTVLSGSPAELNASFVRAETEATCDSVSGSSEIAELTFGGQTLEVTGAPNQTVTIPGVATLIINEQTSSSRGAYREITVNAIHLIVPGVAEVILSGAHSDIKCAPPPPRVVHDFVTGGGWIVTGGRGHFGFNVGFKGARNEPVAHFHYIDQKAGLKMKATSLTLYEQGPTPNSRRFEGQCEVNGVPGHTYRIDVADFGEPGRGRDTFRIVLSNGYVADGILDGGNIQLHTAK